MGTDITSAARDLILERTGPQAAWIKWAALSSMIMALFAAIGALFSSITANESVLQRTEEILQASHMENDKVRVEILRAKHEILQALAPVADPDDSAQLARLNAEIVRLERAIAGEEAKVQTASRTHEIFAIGITLLSAAIALTGMAVVAGRQFPWHTGLAFGAAGCGFVVYGLVKFF